MELCNIIDNNLFLLKKIRNKIIDNEMWFVAKDICDILDAKDVTVAISKLPEKFKKMHLLVHAIKVEINIREL